MQGHSQVWDVPGGPAGYGITPRAKKGPGFVLRKLFEILVVLKASFQNVFNSRKS